MTFLEKLEDLMKSMNIKNLYALSEKSGIPYMTLRNFYNRGTDNVQLSTIKKLVSFFGCTIDYLARDEITDKSYSKCELEEELQQNKLSKEEKDLIKVYRTLDKRGKITVNGLLSIESSILSNTVKLDKIFSTSLIDNKPSNNISKNTTDDSVSDSKTHILTNTDKKHNKMQNLPPQNKGVEDISYMYAVGRSRNVKKYDNSKLIAIPTEELKELESEIENGKYNHLFEGDDSPI